MGTKFDTKTYTGGNITVNSLVWINLQNALDLYLNDVKVGDLVAISFAGIWNNQAVDASIDVVSVVGGAVVNSFTEGSQEFGGVPDDSHVGNPSWYGPTSVFMPVGGVLHHQVVASDLNDGDLLMRFRTKTGSAANKVLSATATAKLLASAVNLGQ